MEKVIKTKAELIDLVLEKMHRYEGCEKLSHIGIEIDQNGAWFIAPCDSTARFSKKIKCAALAAQIALRYEYDVEASERRDIDADNGDRRRIGGRHAPNRKGMTLRGRIRLRDA
jgi:hypothetical protein